MSVKNQLDILGKLSADLNDMILILIILKEIIITMVK
jgi:hypothetical protein